MDHVCPSEMGRAWRLEGREALGDSLLHWDTEVGADALPEGTSFSLCSREPPRSHQAQGSPSVVIISQRNQPLGQPPGLLTEDSDSPGSAQAMPPRGQLCPRPWAALKSWRGVSPQRRPVLWGQDACGRAVSSLLAGVWHQGEAGLVQALHRLALALEGPSGLGTGQGPQGSGGCVRAPGESLQSRHAAGQ